MVADSRLGKWKKVELKNRVNGEKLAIPNIYNKWYDIIVEIARR